MNIIDYIMIFLFLLGIILVTYELSIRNVKCPANKVLYKYVSINDVDINNPLDDVITNIFNKRSPWIGSIENKKKD
jgi:hypothetical protein